MCEKPLDLGRQEPRGCRFVYGDPGDDGWRYCQRTLAPGAVAGDAKHPPYCVRHTKVCMQPETEAARNGRLRFLERIAESEEKIMYDARGAFWGVIPVDMYVKSRLATGEISHD